MNNDRKSAATFRYAAASGTFAVLTSYRADCMEGLSLSLNHHTNYEYAEIFENLGVYNGAE
jgi:hypothetical protein